MLNRYDAHDPIVIARKELSAIPVNTQAHEAEINAREHRMAEIDIAVTKLNREMILPVESEMAKLEARKTVLTAPKRITELSGNMKPYQFTLNTLAQQQSTVVAQLVPIDAEINRYRSAIETIQSRIRYNELQPKLISAQQSIRSLESELRALNNGRENARRDLDNARARLASLQTQQAVDYALNHGPCTCGCDGYHCINLIHAVSDGELNLQICDAQQGVMIREGMLRDADTNIVRHQQRLEDAHHALDLLQIEASRLNTLANQSSRSANQADLAFSVPHLQELVQQKQVLRAPLERQRLELQFQIEENRRAKAALESERDALNLQLTNAIPLADSDAEINKLSDVDGIVNRLTEKNRLYQQYLANQAEMQRERNGHLEAVSRVRAAISQLNERRRELTVFLEYPDAVDRFEGLLQAKPFNADMHLEKLYQYGWNLVNCIKNEKTIAENKHHSFDQKLHADILNAASEVVQTQGSLASLQQLDAVSKRNKDGKLSIAKIVIGAIGMFIGAAFFITGSMILAGMAPVLSLPVAASGITIGAALFVAGVALCVHGRQKGVDKLIHDFRETAPKAYHPVRMFYHASEVQGGHPQAGAQPASAPPYEY